MDSENLAAILELNTPGLMVESSTVREYHTTYGAHILGYMGAMTDAEWQENQKLGYSMDADVGKSGFEQAFETYLHGIDGQRLDKVTKEGTIVSQQYLEGKEPVAGNNVETTIDIDLQKVAEDALAKRMKELTDPNINTGGEGEGIDAQGAAVVVMKVKTGEILACASYPTFNLATMKEDWDAINSDDLKPLFNRAFGATYPPAPPTRCAPWWPLWKTWTPPEHPFTPPVRPSMIRACSATTTSLISTPPACSIPAATAATAT